VKLSGAALAIGLGLVVRFLIPCPAGISMQAWQLLSIFLATIAGLVLEPLPVGAWSFCGLTVAVMSKTLTFTAAFGAFTNDVIWLIVISFFFAKGFVQTGLGDRVANIFVKFLGKSTLGLSYGLVLSETLIAPAMPSTTARAGGVFLPIIKSLSAQAGSLPGPTANKLGAFLVQVQLQACAHSSALFLTAAAQNMLSLKLATGVFGLGFMASPWITWFKAATVPALVSLIAIPYIIYVMEPPEIKETPEAPALAEQRLKEMGPLSRDESIMTGTMLVAVTMWIFGDKIGVPAVVTAMFGLCLLLLTGVVKWADCLAEKAAWDTLFWFAVLIGMSTQLQVLGLIGTVSNGVAASLAALNLGWPGLLTLLSLAYFFIHYMFASQTAQVGSLVTAFLAVFLAAGVPPVLGALVLAYVTNLFGGINHYASGQAAVYYGAGYNTLANFFKVGLVCGIASLLIWGGVGAVWWKIIGLY